MAYSVSTDIQNALDASVNTGLILRYFVLIEGWDLSNVAQVWGFWTGAENIATNVIDPETGVSTSRSFVGSSILEIPEIPIDAGLEFQQIRIELNPLNSTVNTMMRNNNIRAARIDVYRGYFSTDTHLLVDEPIPIFAGKVDGSKITTPTIFGSGTASIECVSFKRELAKKIGALKSDEWQKLRSGDRWRRYESREMQIWWGEVKSAQNKATAKKGLLGWGNFLGFL